MTEVPVYRLGQVVVVSSPDIKFGRGSLVRITGISPSWLTTGFDYSVNGDFSAGYGAGCFVPYAELPDRELKSLLVESFLR